MLQDRVDLETCSELAETLVFVDPASDILWRLNKRNHPWVKDHDPNTDRNQQRSRKIRSWAQLGNPRVKKKQISPFFSLGS